MPGSTHPAGQIMDYLHMQLRLGKMNEEHLAEGRIWEGFRHLAPVTQTPGCFEESERDVVLEGDTKKVKLFLPLLLISSSLFVQNVPRSYQSGPGARSVHQRLSSPADWASLSICRVIASNQGLQQTNPDRSSHLGFTLGQLWCHAKAGMERGKASSQ